MNGRAILAWNLRSIRTSQGISQEKLAADSGIDRAYLSELERERGNATVDLLEKLAKSLEVTIADLFAAPPAGSRRPKPLMQGRRPAKKGR